MKYICLFDTEAEYEAKKDDLAVPNVSYCKDTDKVKLLSEHIVDFNGDSAAESYCLSHWDTNGDGKLSFEEAAAVTSLGTNGFKNNTTIIDYRFLKYFTGLNTLPAGCFAGSTGVQPIYNYVAIPKTAKDLPTNTFGSTESHNILELHLYWETINDSVLFHGSSLNYTTYYLPIAADVTKVIIPKGTTAQYEASAVLGRYTGKFEEREY